MSTLYSMADQYTRSFENWEDGLIPEEAVTDTLEAMEGEITEKVDGIASLIKEYRKRAEVMMEEVKALTDRAKTIEKRAEWLKGYLLAQMDKIGTAKVETVRNNVRVSLNYAVEINDPEAFRTWADMNAPELLRRTEKIEPDKKGIKEAIAQGKEIPGAEITERKSITIK